MYCHYCGEIINENSFKPCECDINLHQSCVKNYCDQSDLLIIKNCKECGYHYKYDYITTTHVTLHYINSLIYDNYKLKVLTIFLSNLVLLSITNLTITLIAINVSIFIDLFFIIIMSYYIGSINLRELGESFLICGISSCFSIINNKWIKLSLYLFSLKFMYSLRKYYYINSSKYFYIKLANNYTDTVNNFI